MRYFKVLYTWEEYVKVDVPENDESNYYEVKKAAEKAGFGIAIESLNNMGSKELLWRCGVKVEEIDKDDYMEETGEDEEREEIEEDEELESLEKPWKGEFPG